MVDDNNSVDSTEAELEFPPPARFDESAAAKAQPVQPIPTNGVAVWIQGAHYARQMLTGRTKALPLVLVGGLAIGTLGGTMLMKERGSSTDAAPAVQESTGETPAAQVIGAHDETRAAQTSAMALQSAGQPSSRIRRHRIRPPVQRGQRAYRVAVIR